jgi:CubicO group peptidase (beta-lactamase class C family)
MRNIGVAAMGVAVYLGGLAVETRAAGGGPDGAFEAAIVQGRSALRALVNQSPVPAVSVAVAVDGEIVWAEAFGSASLELGVRADPHTRFRIASVAKPLTATTLMRLAQEGRIDLDAPVASFGDDLAHLPETLTVRHLARHTGGVRHYHEGEISVDEYYPTLADAATIFLDDPLLFEPGTSCRYTTFGYTLLGLVMERATGLGFRELMSETLFEPLGMNETLVENWYLVTPDRAAGYEYRDEHGIINAQPSDNSCRLPGGGMLSTPTDLVRFGSALLEPGFLGVVSLADLFDPTIIDGESVGYAMGWMIEEDARGRPVYRHKGSQPGTRAQLVVYPREGVVVAAIANVTNAPLGFDEVQAIAEPFLGIEAASEPPAVDPVGEYRLFVADDRTTDLMAELSIWREFDGPLVASAAVRAEGRRMILGSVHVSGTSVRAIGYSAQGIFDGQLSVIEFDAGSGEGEVFAGGKLIPVRVAKVE